MIFGVGASTGRFWDLGALSQTYHFLINIVSNRMISGFGASTARSWDVGVLSQTDHFLIKILIGCFAGSAPPGRDRGMWAASVKCIIFLLKSYQVG